MIGFLNHIDHQIFLFLNGMHNPFFDQVMYTATKGILWLPVYLVFLYLVIRKYRWQSLWILLFAALMITASDQLANLVKDLTHRYRPSQETGLEVHLVNAYKGGTWGFYSAHASNTFSVAVFLILVLGDTYRWFFIPALLWALFMSYTRIYLGVHFPGDTLAGMAAGTLIGIVFATLSLLVIRKIQHKDSTGPHTRTP
ncbi:MAG TPA: phosphatase PAP2 family protein [Bacteroidales bacterium]|nr:phosphatase PAP2 family protein [Bacteroidales bacterium]